MKAFLLFLFLGITNVVIVGQISLVKDITPGSPSSDLTYFTPFGEKLLFMEELSGRKANLWISDGTEQGTMPIFSFPYIIQGFVPFRDKVLFAAYDSIHGSELWITDGTTVGTYLVKDINPGEENGVGTLGGRRIINESGSYHYREIYNNEFYFPGNDGINGLGLWKTNGTEVGTVLVKDIFSGPEYGGLLNFIQLNNLLFFTVDRELWRSDGTETGTVLVKTIYSANRDLNNFTVFKNHIFFTTAKELWKTDGTEQGTVLIRTFEYPEELLATEEYLYFTAAEEGIDRKIWKTDGTTEGTEIFSIDTLGTDYDHPSLFTYANEKLFFAIYTEEFGVELWTSDETPQGTQLVKDIYPGEDTGIYGELIPFKDGVFFVGFQPATREELWVSDGTSEGTHLVEEIFVGPTRSFIFWLTVVSNNLFFIAGEPTYGRELYKLSLDSLTSTSILKEHTFPAFKIFPNPANSNLHIEFQDGQFKDLRVEIFDIMGKCLLQKNITSNSEVDISSIKSGTYFLKIWTDDMFVTKKIIKL